jgi:hypothetical protein
MRTTQKAPLATITPLLHVPQPLSSIGRFSDSIVVALSKYATILSSVRSGQPLKHAYIMIFFVATVQSTVVSVCTGKKFCILSTVVFISFIRF